MESNAEINYICFNLSGGTDKTGTRKASLDIWPPGPSVLEAVVLYKRPQLSVRYFCYVIGKYNVVTHFHAALMPYHSSGGYSAFTKESWCRSQTTLRGICNGQVPTLHCSIVSVLHEH